MYVCGTNAFDPECDYLVRHSGPRRSPAACPGFLRSFVSMSLQSYAGGQLTLERKVEDGKGKCPFDPFQRHASLMFGGYRVLDGRGAERGRITMRDLSRPPGNDLYSATSMNFLGSEPALLRSSPVAIRTEFKNSWLNGKMSPEGGAPLGNRSNQSTFRFLPPPRAHLRVHDSGPGEPDERGGRRRQGLPVLQRVGCGVRLLQQAAGVPRGPRLQGGRVPGWAGGVGGAFFHF